MKTVNLLIAGAIVALLSCTQMKPENGYIGPSGIKVEDGIMSPEVLLSFGRLSDPRLSPDGKTVIYGVSYTSIPENRSVRNLFALSLDEDGGVPEKVQLTAFGKSVSNARWAPDGSAVFFLKGGQIYRAPWKGGSLGKARIISDVPDGIDEFSLSPDGRSVMYVSQVSGPVRTPADSDPALDKAKAYETDDLMYRHWDHWVETIPHTFVAPVDGIEPGKSVDILGGADVPFQLPNGPFGGLEQLSWSPDGRFIAYSCKKLSGKQYAFSTNTCIYIYDRESGKTISVTSAGGYDTDPAWNPDGSALCWLSMDRDGYEADQVRLKIAGISPAASDETDGFPLVAGPVRVLDFPFNVESPVWSQDGSAIYFSALYEDAVQGIFRCPSDFSAVPELITPKADWHDYSSPFAVLPDGTLLTSWCSMDFPTELIALKDGGARPLTDENGHILSQLKPITTELRDVRTVDGKNMKTWVLFPPEFDVAKQYPAIEILLGGPQGTLSQGWSYRWNYRLMASQGFVVVLPNRRGTTAFGQPWCEEISGDYIGLNMQDYLSAARMIKSEPFVRSLAGCGASYGGYSVYYLAGIHKDVFDCFIAHAGIFNEEHMYMTTEEMWFPNWDNGGIPLEYAFEEGQRGPAGDGITFGGLQQAGSPWSAKPEAVRHYSNSPHTLVRNWHTPILCIHGGSDFRVPYDEGMAAFNAAQMMGVPSKLIVFPDENHWILQPQNALYWHRSYFYWLNRWL